MSRRKLPSRGRRGRIVRVFQLQDTFDVIKTIISTDLVDDPQHTVVPFRLTHKPIFSMVAPEKSNALSPHHHLIKELIQRSEECH